MKITLGIVLALVLGLVGTLASAEDAPLATPPPAEATTPLSTVVEEPSPPPTPATATATVPSRASPPPPTPAAPMSPASALGQAATPTPPPTPTPTQAPTPAPPKPTRTAPPRVTPPPPAEAEALAYVPSLNARVTGWRFFERELDPYLPSGARVYKKTFSQRTTRLVGWGVRLAYPAQSERIEYEIEVVYYRPDGIVFARWTRDIYVAGGRRVSWRSMGRGWRLPGPWRTGLHKAELFIDGQLITSGQFEIVDSPLPTQGPFGDLRQSLAWNTLKPSVDEEKALLALSELMEIDPSLATLVASRPWVQRIPSEEGRGALQLFEILAREDLDLAERVIGFSWLADDVTKDEWLTLRTLSLLAVRDAAWANFISDFDWLNDGITEEERSALADLHSIIIEHPSLAETLLSLPWLGDQLTKCLSK